MALTDTTVRNAKARDRTLKLFDGGGLHLVVNPAGSKLWRMKYRVHGREKLLSIGAYPAVSLKAARQARDKAKGLIAAGQDPSTAKRQARAVAAAGSANTFSAIAAELLDKLRKEKKARNDRQDRVAARHGERLPRQPADRRHHRQRDPRAAA